MKQSVIDEMLTHIDDVLTDNEKWREENPTHSIAMLCDYGFLPEKARDYKW